ncbi:carboxypeptidase regulatory-like domain-containing protein [Bremerella cremea]|uniref:Carboxypeptidase regulatory-like domain-containing protein n=2 Tax=Bremerella cremea TaxID=1031537 RepID=A0A368KLL1_9BACT|nr:carboxypeptidase regulatory-like domain-containing protein [Bremerella cremea]
MTLMVLTAVVALTGCDTAVQTDYSKLGLVEVSGKITFDGKPLSDATVMFEAPDETYSYGKTDESGHYTMMFNTEKTGVTPGKKIVRVVTGSVGDIGAGEGDEEEEQSAPAQQVAVPKCYNQKSKIEVDVKTSATFNFDLKTDCSTTGPS